MNLITNIKSYKEKKEFDKNYYIALLKKAEKELMHTPTIDEINRLHGYPKGYLFIKYFGTWNNALEAAGLKINKISGKSYNDNDLIFFLNKAALELGHSPNALELDELKGYPCSLTYKHHFGTWSKALAAADLDMSRYRASYTSEELINYLKKALEELGHAPTIKEMDKLEKYPSTPTFKLHFGSWNKALEAAGLKIHSHMNEDVEYSRITLARLILKARGRLVDVPTITDLVGFYGQDIERDLIKEFGSFENALVFAGLLKRN